MNGRAQAWTIISRDRTAEVFFNINYIGPGGFDIGHQTSWNYGVTGGCVPDHRLGCCCLEGDARRETMPTSLKTSTDPLPVLGPLGWG